MLTTAVAAQPGYIYPGAGNFNSSILSPAKFPGYNIGTQHTRHYRLVEYFKELDRPSERMTLEQLEKHLNTDNRLQLYSPPFTSCVSRRGRCVTIPAD